MFVNTPEHIHAHLLVCFIALTMMRLVQRRIAMAEPKSDAGGDLKWSYGMSGERLSKALREWQALRHPGDQYQMVKRRRLGSQSEGQGVLRRRHIKLRLRA